MQLSVRILTPENVVKYVVIDQGIFDAEEHLRDEDFDLDLFPILPTGDWTTGYVMAVHGRVSSQIAPAYGWLLVAHNMRYLRP